ncbi:MAG: 4Fe-4S dicluster domain-containing protein [Chloroflexota bacterium]
MADKSVNVPTVKPAKAHILANSSLCGGCRTCEAVCSLDKEGIVNPELSRIYVKKDILGGYICEPIPCKQCEDPACLLACPTGALHIDCVTGARVIDDRICDGCQLCLEVCPVTPTRIGYHPEQNVCFKCDLCGGDPQCVKFCPMGALTYLKAEGV